MRTQNIIWPGDIIWVNYTEYTFTSLHVHQGFRFVVSAAKYDEGNSHQHVILLDDNTLVNAHIHLGEFEWIVR